VTFFERCSQSRFWFLNPGARGKGKCLPVGGGMPVVYDACQDSLAACACLSSYLAACSWPLSCLVRHRLSRASLVPAIRRIAVSKLLSVERWSGGPSLRGSWTPGLLGPRSFVFDRYHDLLGGCQWSCLGRMITVGGQICTTDSRVL
jgi:hypothetical protein